MPTKLTRPAFETILVERDGSIATITLNRPAVLNALNLALLNELSDAIDMLQDDDSVRVAILTGAGERAFAAGADISELSAMATPAQGEQMARTGQRVTRALERMRKPVIAAINGFALGGGCELAMAADIRIASENARFGQPEVNLGLIPGFGGTARTSRLLGRGMAMYLCLSGETIDAAQALRAGLVQQVVPPAELLEVSAKLARTIASKSPLAVAATKAAIDDGLGLRLDDALVIEALRFGSIVGTADFKEGTAAFLQKRKPNFTGS